MKRKILIFIVALSLIFIPTQSVSAEGLEDGPVIFGGSYTLESGEKLHNDVVVFGGTVMVEEGALVTGDIILFGGSLTINGEVNGEVSLVGGAAILGENSLIDGNLTLVSASLHRADGAEVTGEISYNAANNNANSPTIPAIPGLPEVPFVQQEPLVFFDNPLWTVGSILGRSFAMALLAMLVALFLEEPTRRVGEAIVAQPAVAGGLGFLTIVFAPVLAIVLLITILLIPVGILLILALMIALLYGWIALGFEVGARFTKMINQEWQLPLSAAFGTWLLTIISASFDLIPCIGWLVSFIIATIALGGVIISRFGTQTTVRPVSAVVEASPLPPVDGEEE
ncbi:MAG: polymer-forming cytoskeletal protein [Chloroflexi bacterium]|nr:polymer-forming cytoskeletal protein [Chloroflexota bacterium]